LDRLDVAYTKFESASSQKAVVETLLPLAEVGQVANLSPQSDVNLFPQSSSEPQYEFLPSAESILDEVVPTSFRVRLFKCFLDAAVSEQIARMVAMKAATENADGMISQLSMAYNRARQGQITNELLEIIGGAEALNE
jgi:F-type H+-transporting ATPase subunit gamma